MENIIKLDLNNYHKCNNIWNMENNKELADRFYNELSTGNRETFIYEQDGKYIGEISIVYDKKDSDYTIANTRLYISRLIVNKDYRQKGIGTKLINFIIEYAMKKDFKEISIGVNIDNFKALKLYIKLGFNNIIYIGEDEDGKYLKLLKKL